MTAFILCYLGKAPIDLSLLFSCLFSIYVMTFPGTGMFIADVIVLFIVSAILVCATNKCTKKLEEIKEEIDKS